MNYKQSPMDTYWLIWFLSWFTSFIGPEIWAIATGHPENTLSASVWRFEKVLPGQPMTQWTFAHFAFMALFVSTAVWLTGHFGFEDWA